MIATFALAPCMLVLVANNWPPGSPGPPGGIMGRLLRTNWLHAVLAVVAPGAIPHDCTAREFLEAKGFGRN